MLAMHSTAHKMVRNEPTFPPIYPLKLKGYMITWTLCMAMTPIRRNTKRIFCSAQARMLSILY